VTASLRNAEIRALRQIVEACEGEGHDVGDIVAAQSAAVILRGALKRFDGSPKAKVSRGDPIPSSAREAVYRRSGGRCEAQTIWCMGKPTQIHHIDRDRKNNDPENLLHVCGMGNVNGCHGRIHSHPNEAYAAGWLTRRNR
jgi:hypothetical protein